MMSSLTLQVFLLGAAVFSTAITRGAVGGLLSNGTNPHAFPNWKISGYVEYIKSGHKQGDMLLVVPEGAYAVRLGNEASKTHKLNVKKGSYYSITFSTARTCAQEEKLNVPVYPNSVQNDWEILPTQTIYSSSGWDLYSWAFRADASSVEFTIHNPG